MKFTLRLTPGQSVVTTADDNCHGDLTELLRLMPPYRMIWHDLTRFSVWTPFSRPRHTRTLVADLVASQGLSTIRENECVCVITPPPNFNTSQGRPAATAPNPSLVPIFV